VLGRGRSTCRARTPGRSALRRARGALLAAILGPALFFTTAWGAGLTVTPKGLGTGLVSVPAYRCTDTRSSDSPVSYWRLDETSGTSATDSTGGRTGTYTGGYTLNQTGALSDVADKAVTFNGTTGYVAVPYAAALNPAQFTLEAWAKPTGGSGTWRLVASSWTHPSGYQGYWVGIDSSNRWTAHLGDGVNPEAKADGPSAVLNTWTHLVETYDGATLKFYVNSTLVASTATTRYSPNTSPTQFDIGAEYFNGAQTSFFLGSIDEVSVYNSALTAAKIRSHYNAERCYRDEVLVDSPTAYWRLGETTADSVARDVKNTYPGTYTGGPTQAAAGALNQDGDTSATFNGTSQYVSIPYNGSLNPNSVTLEAWAKPTGGTGTARTVAASQDTNKGYLLGIGTDNKWRFTVGTGTAVNVAAAGATVTLNTWAHVVGVYNGTTATLYVDGLSVGSVATGRSANTTRPLGIGASNSGGTWAGYFPGSIDDVALYPSALTQTRVQAHYLVGRSYQDSVLDTDPVSYWRLGESSGTSAADSKGSNTGTYTNAPTLVQPGALAGDSNTAVSFDGSNDYVRVPTAASLNITSAITIEAWIQVRAWDYNWQAIVTKGDSDYRLHRWMNSDNLSFDTNGGYDVQGAANVNDGSWHHVVATWDGSTKYMYVDGVLDTTLAFTGPLANNSYDLAIGENLEMTGRYWDGLIDEVAVYNRALSATEVQLHYTSGWT
jgi:hypothetical protein